MIYSPILIQDDFTLPAAAEILPDARVVVTAGAVVLADDTAAGVGLAHTFVGGRQAVRPRQVGRTAHFLTDEAVTEGDPLYAKAGGLVGALTAAEPLCCYALESIGAGGGRITGLWV